MSSLTVHLNRQGPRDLDAPATFETRRPFDVVLKNHGDGSHVHLELDDALASVARLSTDTVFVDGDVSERVRVDTRPVEDPIEGTLRVAVGYGAEERAIDVTLAQYRENPDQVDVDEDLSTPTRDPEADGGGLDLERVGLVVLAALALLVALWTATIAESPAVTAGAAVVAVAVAGVVAWSLR